MTDSDLRERLLGMELDLLDQAVRHSEARLRKLLADDFIEFGSSGRIYDKQSIIDELLQSESKENFELDEFRLLSATGETGFVTYSCIARSESGRIVRKSIRSSLWRLTNAHWQLLFHQGTRTG